MSSLTDNVNLFQPSGFKVIIDRKNYGNLEFFAQTVNHPGVNVGPAPAMVSRLESVPLAGDTLTFGELSLTILLDEDLNAYMEMFNWMVRLVNENQRSQSEALISGELPTNCDIKVVALTSHNNSNKIITYRDAIPVSIGDINFEASTGDVQYTTIPVSFRFTYFEIE